MLNSTVLLLVFTATLTTTSGVPIFKSQRNAANAVTSNEGFSKNHDKLLLMKTKKFWSSPYPSFGNSGASAHLIPYASGDGFVSAFPSNLMSVPDKWAGYLAEEQFGGLSPGKRAEDKHFAAHWMDLADPVMAEPGRLEWNFNRL